jgi:hypothetical protein
MGKSLASAAPLVTIREGKIIDLLDDGLVDKLETPDITTQPLDIEQVEPRKVFDPAQLDVKLDFIPNIDRMLSIDRFLGSWWW